MEISHVQLNDLPDEILMIIFKKMNNVALLYSLIGVNKRLNKIVHASVFTSCLTIMKRVSNISVSPFCDLILDRFCSQVLPAIHHKIKWLNLESLSMERILLASDYPNLHRLGLCNIEDETAKHLFSNEILSSGIFKKQISTLVIIIDKNKEMRSTKNIMKNICNGIFPVFTNLLHLHFTEWTVESAVRLSFDFPPSMFFSSTLLELNMKVHRFDECLYLLDGRFNQLQTFYVNILSIIPLLSEIKQGELPNLKCFSLSCDSGTDFYNELIIPLLRRMSNLEELALYLKLNLRHKAFIDGNNLKMDIISHMPQLNKFIFNIRSIIYLKNQIYLPSNADIQQTLRDFRNNQIISSVDYFPDEKKDQCLIYSYPYTMRHYECITNNFSGGLFKYVQEVSLFDEHPFEHEFFLRIVQSFPFMKKLSLTNNKPQNDKSSRKNDVQSLPIIKYLHLAYLDIHEVHDDYTEQFLVDTITYLPNDIFLQINYKSLQRVTNNFTRDTTRNNCAKMTYVCLFNKPEFPQDLQNYFPLATKIR